MVKRVIKEYHEGQQLMLPFDGSSEPYNYMQFIEYLETIGRYGKIASPTKTFEECISDPDLLFNCGLYLLFDVDESFDEYRTSEFVKKLVHEYGYYIFTDEINDEISRNYDSAIDAINDSGLFDFYHMTDSDFFSIFKDVTIVNQKLIEDGREEIEWLYEHSFTTNELGQIYCERVIDIPNPTDRWHEKGYNNDEEELDYFQSISKNYKTIGDCWTYAKDAGDCYNSMLRGGTKINLIGWVNPEDVNWEETVHLEQMDEYEIRLLPNSPVQIDAIEIIEGDNRGKKLPLKGSIVVKA